MLQPELCPDFAPLLVVCSAEHACRREFITCEARLLKEGRRKEAALFNLREPDVSLHDTCNYRCACRCWMSAASLQLPCT